MKWHRTVVRLTVINGILSLAMFVILFKAVDREDRFTGVFSAWVAWLLVLGFIEPLFFSDEVRAQWFGGEYGKGTVVLLVTNILVAIGANIFAYIIVP